MLNIIKYSLEHGNILEVWECQSSKGSKQPGSPASIQDAYFKSCIIFCTQQNEHNKESNVAWIQDKEPSFGDDFEIEGENKAKETNNKPYLFYEVPVQTLGLVTFRSQQISPIPCNEDGY